MELCNSQRSYPTHRRCPSYLYRHSSGYIFRIRIPCDIQPFLGGKQELRKSLKIGTLGEAKYRARFVAANIQRVFRNIRNGGDMADMTPDEIDKLMQGFFKEVLDDYETMKAGQTQPSTDEELENNRFAYWDQESEYREKLAKGDHSVVRNSVDNLLKAKELDLDKGSDAYLRLCREMMKTQVRLMEILQKREFGDYSDDEAIRNYLGASPSARPSGDEAVEIDEGVPLSKLIDHYAADNRRAGSWTDKTEGETMSSLALFLECLGDVGVKTVDRRMVSEYMETLYKLPPNIRKSPKYRDLTLRQILGMKHEKIISNLTIRKHMSRVTALFGHAEKFGFVDKSPAVGVLPRKEKRQKEARAVFTDDELKRLFHSKQYIEDDHKHSYQFWIPILGLFTGARQNELAQLYVDDVKQVDGVWVIDINDDSLDKKLKNQSSKRLVPLHPFLLDELSFVSGFVAKVKAAGHKRLFPELKGGRDGYGQYVSKWFNNKYKVDCGVFQKAGEGKKDFHSFRGTFATHLAHKRVEDKMLKQVLGHADDGSTTFSVYVDDFTPKQLLDMVTRALDLELDLSHLKKSKFVLCSFKL